MTATQCEKRAADKGEGAPSPALIAALDMPGAHEALCMADTLAGLPLWLKVGLELFVAEGPLLVKELLERKLPVFLDLKFHDIPNTVFGAVRSACMLGVHMCTLHISGGESMCRAAIDARKQARGGRGEGLLSLEGKAPPQLPLLMGVTVLTSTDGNFAEIQAEVVERALLAKRSGLDGIVCSGREAAAVKTACGDDFLCLCPGIRFAEEGAASKDDQARVCTPEEAVAAGADFLVMGRPITRAKDPALAARNAHMRIALAHSSRGR